MDQPPWTLKHQQSVATGLEREDELLNNGNSDNLLETPDINYNNENKCDRKFVENDLEAAIRFVLDGILCVLVSRLFIM